MNNNDIETYLKSVPPVTPEMIARVAAANQAIEKEEKQRIAIAEACGWKDVKLTDHETVDIDSRSITYWSGFTGLPPEFRHHLNRVRVPDYLNDLNAMHEAEQILWGMNWSNRYAFNDNLANTLKGRTVNRNEWDAETLLDATAAQRAEAFLRTIGKWEKSK